MDQYGDFAKAVRIEQEAARLVRKGWSPWGAIIEASRRDAERGGEREGS